jgi:hypothetical protein
VPSARRTLLLLSAPLVAVFLTVTPSPLGAQQTNPIDDLILRVIADLNDLRYGDAIRRGRDALGSRGSMTPAQEARLRTVVAAAFYPEEAAAQQPDSAIVQLVAAVRLRPDLTIPIEVRWAGLDSLLGVARGRTFAVLVSGEPQELVGPEGRGTLRVQSSRPARFRLSTALVGSSVTTRQDEVLTPATEAGLRYRAHDGRDVLLAPGEYDARIVAQDAATGDSVVLVRRLVVEGQRLLLVAPPVFDASRLQPERVRGSITKRAVVSALLAGAVFTAASFRKDGDFDDEFNPSGTSVGLGLGVFAVGVSTHWLGRGRRDAQAVAANARVREEHRRGVEGVEEENRRRVEGYRVRVSWRE